MRRLSSMPSWAILACVAIALCLCHPASLLGEEKPSVGEVIFVFKTHFDIGYTDMAKNVVERYRTSMIDQALRVVDENRNLPPEQQFVWTLPGWPMAKIAEDWSGQTPERKEKIGRAIKEGRFAIHALPFTTHTELLEPEDLVRGLGFASKVSREAGLPLPRDAKMTDVPSHCWIMPTLLKHAGVEFLHLGCNNACSSPRVPPLFWWEGPDGSRVLVMYSAGGYGTGTVPPKDWPHRTWLGLHHTGDNHGPPTPDEVKKLLDEAAQQLPGVKVRIGRLSDFADAILAEKAEIPVVRGDMPDTWIHGPMCDPAGAKIARNIRPQIFAAESLATLLKLWGVKSVAADDTIARAYEQSLLYHEHTWGAAQYWVNTYGKDSKWHYGQQWTADRKAKRFERTEASWAEHTAYIESARELIVPELAKSLQTLAASVATAGERIVVFNPLPHARGGVVSLLRPDKMAGAVRDAENGEILPAQSSDGQLTFVARDIPAMGYRTYVPLEKAPAASSETGSLLAFDAAHKTIENRFVKIELDSARGAIRSMIDKRSGRELVDSEGPNAFGQYVYERFDADNVAAFLKAYVKIDAEWTRNEIGKPGMPPAAEVPYHAASPKDCALTFERSNVAVTAVLQSKPSAELPHGVTLRVTLWADEPYCDLEVTVHDKAADPWPEAGWLCLPLRVDQPQFRMGRLGAVIDPAKDIIAGSGHNLMAVHTGAAIFDTKGQGAAFCPIDTPLVSFETPGCWKYSPDFVPHKPVAWINLFNNQWTTNFRMWNEGTWSSRVRVWAVDQFHSDTDLIAPSLRTRYGLLASTANGPAGQQPNSQQGLAISAPGTVVTAFGPNPDGKDTVLRLWELSGTSGACTLTLPHGLSGASMRPIDLRGRPLGESHPITKGQLPLDLKGFAPASYSIDKIGEGQ